MSWRGGVPTTESRQVSIVSVVTRCPMLSICCAHRASLTGHIAIEIRRIDGQSVIVTIAWLSRVTWMMLLLTPMMEWSLRVLQPDRIPH